MFPKQPHAGSRRVIYQLRSTGVKLGAANLLRSGTHTRGYLPHVKREGASYFVTFRLADSLPKAALMKLQAERASRLAPLEKGANATLREIERDYFRQLEEQLDRGGGSCWLGRSEIADLVTAALQHFDGERYRLDAWVVMPNHVHVALWPMPNHTLSRIVQSWKRFTAREANRILNRSGMPFWQPEAYDHWIRDDAEHARCCRYISNNPVKAGLCATPEDWKWSSAWKGGET